MDKVPIDVFIAEQFKTVRYRTIVSQLGVDPMTVQVALISYLKDQGVHFVTGSLGEELSGRVAQDLESNSDFSRFIASRKQKSNSRS